MRQTTITCVLIAAVLICPYLCLGDDAGSESAFCAAGGCSCAHQQEQSGGETPRSPTEQDSDCLCQGAIVDGQLRTTGLDQANLLPCKWLVDGAALSSIGSSLARICFEPPHQFPPFSTGRDVCALTCTLQL